MNMLKHFIRLGRSCQGRGLALQCPGVQEEQRPECHLGLGGGEEAVLPAPPLRVGPN